MHVFSASATVNKSRDGFKLGDKAMFITYIHFKDAYGAEALCKLFISREGFKDVIIEKRLEVSQDKLKDERIIIADPGIKEALEKGFAIQLFDQ